MVVENCFVFQKKLINVGFHTTLLSAGPIWDSVLAGRPTASSWQLERRSK